MLGLGDNLYQRAVIRELGPLMLETSWPQLYADLPVQCIKPITKLRTQVKNADRADLIWHARPRTPLRGIGYDGQGTMLDSMLRHAGIQRSSINFDGPPVNKSDRKPYVLIRPATVRSEWRADARNPMPEYLARAADALKDWYTIISVADLQPGVEWSVGDLPFAHETYHHGELLIEDLLSLVAGAAGVVGGVGWLAPAAVAYKVPMLLVHGGWGYSNGPQRIFDARMNISLIEQAIPDKFCMCNDKFHDCNKTISKFEEHLGNFVQRLARQ